MSASPPARAKMLLRSSHRRLRVGISHRDVPSAWSPTSKDSAPSPPAPPGKRPKR